MGGERNGEGKKRERGRKERVKREKGLQLTREGICKTILELVGIVVCICELSHVHTELSQTLRRYKDTMFRSTSETERQTDRQTDRCPHIELLLVASLPIGIRLLQLSHSFA